MFGWSGHISPELVSEIFTRRIGGFNQLRHSSSLMLCGLNPHHALSDESVIFTLRPKITRPDPING
jgi:hypothetical protein